MFQPDSAHSVEQFGLFGESDFRQRRRPSATARMRKINGQFHAEKKAGKVWQENAIILLCKFIKTVVMSRAVCSDFTFEDFRLYAESNGLSKPRSLNAWGALPSAACRQSICEWTGRVSVANRPESHARLIKVWRAI